MYSLSCFKRKRTVRHHACALKIRKTGVVQQPMFVTV